MGLYEPLVLARSSSEAKGGVAAAVGRFWEMVATERYPSVMPMSAAIAPEFVRRHPRAAAIFDNLHMMHDIISDILASPDITRDRKRGAIEAQLAEFRSDRGNTLTPEEWRAMPAHMGGVSAMGGPVIPGRAPADTAAGQHH